MSQSDNTNDAGDEEITGALALLLGDVDPKRQAYLLRSVCPELIIRVTDGKYGQTLVAVEYHLKAAVDIADGTSPLGILAAKNTHDHLERARSMLRQLAAMLGVQIE